MKNLQLHDIEFAAELDTAELGPMETSEKYRKHVKRFLDEMDIRSYPSDSVMQLIYNALVHLRLPKKNEQLRIRTQQTINLIAIVLRILDHHKKIDELTIATYTLNRHALNIIQDLVRSGRVAGLNLLIASSYSFRDKKYYEQIKHSSLELYSSGYAVHLVFAWSHFKITLARCGNDFYQFEGSMNYSENNMAEQLVFKNNGAVYQYDYKFITELMLNQNNQGLEIIC